jgi:acyl carrier protein
VDDTAAVIADVWREVLGVATLEPNDEFLTLGGDSLIAVRIAAKLRQRLGCDVAPDALFREGTVAGLARVLERKNGLTGVREEGWL